MKNAQVSIGDGPVPPLEVVGDSGDEHADVRRRVHVDGVRRREADRVRERVEPVGLPSDAARPVAEGHLNRVLAVVEGNLKLPVSVIIPAYKQFAISAVILSVSPKKLIKL